MHEGGRPVHRADRPSPRDTPSGTRPTGRRHLRARRKPDAGRGGHWTFTSTIGARSHRARGPRTTCRDRRSGWSGGSRAARSGLISGWLSVSAASYGPICPCAVAGRAVPGAGDHALVAGDLAVLDLDPVAQGAARRVEVAVPLRACAARWTAPTSPPVERPGVAALDPVDQLAEPDLHAPGQQHRLDAARGGAAEGREERGRARPRACPALPRPCASTSACPDP